MVIPRLLQDCNDRDPLVRALAIRTMAYIPVPVVTEALSDQIRHGLKDKDAYVRKTAAIAVAKVYTADPRRAERERFVEMLRDLLMDENATVVANAVAALSEIGDRPDGVLFKLNLTLAHKLIAALGESSEYVLIFSCRPDTCLSSSLSQMGTDLHSGMSPTFYSRPSRGR
jgi:AP-2 complex subunit beta-1